MIWYLITGIAIAFAIGFLLYAVVLEKTLKVTEDENKAYEHKVEHLERKVSFLIEEKESLLDTLEKVKKQL